AEHRNPLPSSMCCEIERLEIGDELTIQNCQETLTYRVSEIEIILPDESDKIMIQPRRNMVTLMTCHPYTQNSRRYVVYCDEVGTQPEAA
ncbi:sortase, partial [Bacteroides thetaiotaomicron]|uniref:sortase n=1 Tax=Bacteroides thetaiotaomicron TaxID=818 RepID=UPI001D08E11F